MFRHLRRGSKVSRNEKAKAQGRLSEKASGSGELEISEWKACPEVYLSGLKGVSMKKLDIGRKAFFLAGREPSVKAPPVQQTADISTILWNRMA